MIEINVESRKARDRYNVKSEIKIKGRGEAILYELCGIYDELEEKAPELFHDSLDLFLRTRGFEL